jgi:hypothetical protein
MGQAKTASHLCLCHEMVVSAALAVAIRVLRHSWIKESRTAFEMIAIGETIETGTVGSKMISECLLGCLQRRMHLVEGVYLRGISLVDRCLQTNLHYRVRRCRISQSFHPTQEMRHQILQVLTRGNSAWMHFHHHLRRQNSRMLLQRCNGEET